MPTIDPSKAQFISVYPVDKIVAESVLLQATTPEAEPTVPVLFDTSHDHSAGAHCVVSGMFSIDNQNFYPFGGYIVGSFVPGGNYEYLTVDAYCDAETVYVSGITSYYAAQTLYYYYFMESIA